MSAPKKLYVAATSQNDGKTTVSLGLIHAFKNGRGGADAPPPEIGFIKPVGQRYVNVAGENIDEDSVLVQEACGLRVALRDMSPVAIERHFTREFLRDPTRRLPALEEKIRQSYAAAACNKDMVIVEGTGHAGVGSCFGLSNARVAQMLGAKVVIVSKGGIGRPLDEIELNHALFEKFGVPVTGVIANKVLAAKLEQTAEFLRLGLERMGLRLLGAIPYAPRLTWPNMRQVQEELDCDVINGEENLDNPVSATIVGAMSLHNALRHVCRGCLLITPGDREDLLLGVLMASVLSPRVAVSGVVLTGGIRPRSPVVRILRRTNIPVLVCKPHTYAVASEINEMTVKIRVTDEEKVQIAADLVARHVDLRALWEAL